MFKDTCGPPAWVTDKSERRLESRPIGAPVSSGSAEVFALKGGLQPRRQAIPTKAASAAEGMTPESHKRW